MVLPYWKIEEWNIFEKIVKDEGTSTCKLEAWHQTLDKLLMKAHPSFEDFCQVIMREWIRIEFEMDQLESGNTRNDLRFKACKAERKRHDRILNVATNVNNFNSIVEYLNAMGIASKNKIISNICIFLLTVNDDNIITFKIIFAFFTFTLF